jgi:serine phosphatase RsbU (regulator of sigma subunit)
VSTEIESLRTRIHELESQLDAKTRIATRAMATYQQRALQMEQHAEELRAKNDEVREINERLSAALHVITRDLEQAQRFQQLMLAKPPQSDRVRFGVFYRPAELVGGDVYDIYERRPGEYRVFLADATGHGVQAALRTMLLKAEYDRLKDASTPEQTLTALNASISAKYPGLEMQCSAACFDLVPGGRGKARVRYATAAHPPLVILRGTSSTPVYQAGPFLGVVPTIDLDPIEIEIDAGHRVVIYSDGLEEQWDAANTEFGLARVEAALGSRDHDVTAAVGALVADWTSFLAGSRPDDDATLIAAECLG